MAEAMKKDPLKWERAAGASTHHSEDVRLLTEAVKDANSVLEFGPGNTTDIFIKAGVPRIITCEYIEKWYEVARERFSENMNVGVLLFTDSVPVVVHGLSDDETFDVGFVDAPKGYAAARTIHKGYEDCSRFNTVLFALERCKVVYLHDAIRPLERGTLARLRLMGYEHEFLKSPFGLARIWKREQDENGPDPQDTA
jgi:predicted O-methyltransferase YrrM